jgi:hypothetical protein
MIVRSGTEFQNESNVHSELQTFRPYKWANLLNVFGACRLSHKYRTYVVGCV